MSFVFFSSNFFAFLFVLVFYLVLLVIIFTPTSGVLPHIAPGFDFSEFAICNGIFTIDVYICNAIFTMDIYNCNGTFIVDVTLGFA